MLSLAAWVHPAVVSPRGYRVAESWVILRPTLTANEPNARRLRAHLANHELAKAVHNLGVDAHSLANCGVVLGGGVNTLAMARWTWPSRARGEGFTLESLGRDLLGWGKTEKFDELFSEECTLYRERTKRYRRCECGAETCRLRQTTPGHRRLEGVETTREPYTTIRPVPLEDVVPGHPLWARALAYSAQDAVMALAVYELSLRAMTKQRRDVPWISEISA